MFEIIKQPLATMYTMAMAAITAWVIVYCASQIILFALKVRIAITNANNDEKMTKLLLKHWEEKLKRASFSEMIELMHGGNKK